MRTIRIAVLWVCLLLGSLSTAEVRTRNLTEDPYVKLYQQRVELAKGNERRQKALVDLAAVRYENAKAMGRAISREEYLERYAAYKVATEELNLSKIKISEMEAVFEVVKFLREQGKEVPLFPGDIARQ